MENLLPFEDDRCSMLRFRGNLNGCHFVLDPNGAYFEDTEEPCGAMFHSFFTEESCRRKGLGKTVLRSIRKWADKKNTKVFLWIAPFMDRPLDVKQLRELYERMGFEMATPDAQRIMVYKPHA